MVEHVVAYRGICLSEAMEVVGNQKYLAAEERKFWNDIEIKAVFGSGVYLVSDYTVAAEYAYCHAEANNDKGSVIRQSLCLQNPLLLDGCFGEKEIRSLALAWKYPSGTIDEEAEEIASIGLSRWAGNIIREYVTKLGYDGIIYHIDDTLTYYIAYKPDEQISAVQLDFVYDIGDIRSCTFADLRNQYQAHTEETPVQE
ncbi:hypothetical protein P9597_00395 [Aneurinibacillus migulanus]|uniref:hypothetical protein n=1 Tax=Aneurinibacillus migulanus TaxID=47500 RepID=UPI002E1AB9B5|nr:hypothetical protein [Aneurinibacillus migulanus]